jgi:hypothetical protein
MPKTHKTPAPQPTRKSAVGEHPLNTGHEIHFDKTQRLNTTTIYMDRIVREAQLHAENFNRKVASY